MKVAAYCRVSTGSDEQLNSLKNQTAFFEDYAYKNGYELYRIFADRGISGRSSANRPEYMEMLKCADRKMFDMLLVKDISRFARNTVDFLNGIRRLKQKGIEVRFLSANQTVLGESEFVLTVFAALAQEESYSLSKKIQFGKRIAAQKGRTPCTVYGYKYAERYNLVIKDSEAEVVKLIYDMYINREYGIRKIAKYLNNNNIPAKRGGEWHFKTVRRILSNPIYTGRVVGNKSRTEDFLAGTRVPLPDEEHIVNHVESLRIVTDDMYDSVQEIIRYKNADKHRSG